MTSSAPSATRREGEAQRPEEKGLLADCMKVAEEAHVQLESLTATTKATINMTIDLAEFTKDKLDAAIIQATAGNRLQAIMILADLRLRFDELLKKTQRFEETPKS